MSWEMGLKYLIFLSVCILFLTTEVNIMWAAHQVHHSSEEYNYSTALRQSIFQRCSSWVSVSDLLCVQTRSLSQGTVWRSLIFFTTDRPHYPWMPPLSGDNHGWSGFGCALGNAHIWRKQLCDINYEPKVALPSTFCPRTQHVWWDHWEKSQRASTLWYCRGKSHLAGLSPVNGT